MRISLAHEVIPMLSDEPRRKPERVDLAKRERRWLEENRLAIASINAFIDRHGLLASRLPLPPQSHERPKP
jgi:hypothetical protein